MARNRSTVKRCVVVLALLEMLKEEDDRVTKGGKTRHWIKRRGEEKGIFQQYSERVNRWFHTSLVSRP